MIKRVDPQRDQYGEWTHPELLELIGDREWVPREEWQEWKDHHGIETHISEMEYDLDESDPVWISHFEEGNPGCVGWEPKPPGPEWCVLSIHDTEDGPVVVWYREHRV